MMDYHEIGERFEYDGVVLEVMERTHVEDCKKCYLEKECRNLNRGYSNPTQCHSLFRDSNDDVYFKLVEQCNTKDMEHKTEIKVEGADKTFASHVTNIQSDEEIYDSLLDKLFTTYKAKDKDYGSAFSEMFDELRHTAKLAKDKLAFLEETTTYLEHSHWGEIVDNMYDMMFNKAKSIMRKTEEKDKENIVKPKKK